MNDDEQWEELNRLHDELDFLRWFFDAVQDSLGPATSDIIMALVEEYKKEMNAPVPKDYDPRSKD